MTSSKMRGEKGEDINKKLWIKSFFGLLLVNETPKLNEVDRTNLEDFFTWRTLDLLESGDKKEAEEAVSLMKDFEGMAKSEGNEGLSRFFYSLVILLRFKHDIRMFPRARRESFEKSFKKTKRKLGEMDLDGNG